jgi:GxxExxY protein
MELILKEEVYAVVGAAIEVHRVLGPGFLEPVYQEAMEIESLTRQLPYIAQPILQIHYKEHVLKKEYMPDFIFYDQIIVEIKALDRLGGKEEAQILNYLKATGYKVGVLINFGSHPKLEWKRFVY